MDANKRKAVIGAVAAMVLIFVGLFAAGDVLSKSADSKASMQLANDTDDSADADYIDESSYLDDTDDSIYDREDSGNRSSDADAGSILPAQPATQGALTKADAIKLALTAASGNVTDIEEEQVGASAVYTVQVTKDGLEIDVKIEKSTGKILKIESDTNEADKEINNDMDSSDNEEE
jgi:uncharacterized membrane protein YkoI